VSGKLYQPKLVNMHVDINWEHIGKISRIFTQPEWRYCKKFFFGELLFSTRLTLYGR